MIRRDKTIFENYIEHICQETLDKRLDLIKKIQTIPYEDVPIKISSLQYKGTYKAKDCINFCLHGAYDNIPKGFVVSNNQESEKMLESSKEYVHHGQNQLIIQEDGFFFRELTGAGNLIHINNGQSCLFIRGWSGYPEELWKVGVDSAIKLFAYQKQEKYGTNDFRIIYGTEKCEIFIKKTFDNLGIEQILTQY